jgi:hypothetical protein
VASAIRQLNCTRCQNPLPESDWNAPELRPCMMCDDPFQAVTFPALWRATAALKAETSTVEGEATCYYHSRKKAITPCDRCGRFLCALCEIEFGGERWCPQCLQTGQGKGAIRDLKTGRTNYDSIAFTLSTAPALMIWPTIFTAPVALYLAIRHWRAPAGILPRTRIRYYLAVLFSATQIAGWIWLIAYFSAKNPS